MGSSTVEMSLDPIVLQKQTFTIQKNTPHVHFFQLLLFFLFQQNVHFSFFRSIAICANPNSKRAALERSFQKKNFPRTL
jgi:hypothetical protein